MSDSEAIADSIGRVRAGLRVLRDDQSTLIVASTLTAAADALGRIRGALLHGDGERADVLPLLDFIDELTARLLPLVARHPSLR